MFQCGFFTVLPEEFPSPAPGSRSVTRRSDHLRKELGSTRCLPRTITILFTVSSFSRQMSECECECECLSHRLGLTHLCGCGIVSSRQDGPLSLASFGGCRVRASLEQLPRIPREPSLDKLLGPCSSPRCVFCSLEDVGPWVGGPALGSFPLLVLGASWRGPEGWAPAPGATSATRRIVGGIWRWRSSARVCPRRSIGQGAPAPPPSPLPGPLGGEGWGE